MIRVKELWLRYPEREVLKDISFEVGEGEFVGILGPNGSGKTTLMLALSGILPFQQGEVAILETPLERLSHRERAMRMAAVNQQGEVRLPFPCRDVAWMRRYPHQRRWQMETEQDLQVERAMLLTDSQNLAERLITAISGGGKQRVMMARALAQQTAILLLDEATSAMHIHRKLQMFNVLKDLNRTQALTLLAVSRDINLAAFYCRRLIFLKDGKKVADGAPVEVFTPQVLEHIYQTKVLIHEIAGLGKKQVVFLPS